jgi:hypothetical protein
MLPNWGMHLCQQDSEHRPVFETNLFSTEYLTASV